MRWDTFTFLHLYLKCSRFPFNKDNMTPYSYIPRWAAPFYYSLNNPGDQRFHQVSWWQFCGIKRYFDRIIAVCDILHISNYSPNLISVAPYCCYRISREFWRSIAQTNPTICIVECLMTDHVQWSINDGHPVSYVNDVMQCFCPIFNIWGIVSRVAACETFLLKNK